MSMNFDAMVDEDVGDSSECDTQLQDTDDAFEERETEDVMNTRDEFDDGEYESEEPEDEFEDLGSGKRHRRCQHRHHGPGQKRIRMHAAKGTVGYGTEIREPISIRSNVGNASDPTPHCTLKSHVDLSKPCPSTPITECPILKKMRMYFGSHGFVCKKCGYLYPPSHLGQHIFTKHKKDLDITSTGRARKNHYDLVISHLLTSHGVPEGTQTFDLPDAVTDAIPGLKVTTGYRCPACAKPRWFSWKSMRCHYLYKHKKMNRPSRDDLRLRYIIRPYRLGDLNGGRSELSDVVIMLPEDWAPGRFVPLPHNASTIIQKTPSSLAPCAPHLLAIGWYEYLHSLDGTDVQFVLKLVELPNEKEIVGFPSKRAALEKGILEVDKTLAGYLMDANLFLDGCHPSVRKSVTSG